MSVAAEFELKKHATRLLLVVRRMSDGGGVVASDIDTSPVRQSQ